MEARGIMAPVGSSCEVIGQDGHKIEAEVVGFNDKTLYLMPLTEPVGIGPGSSVRMAYDLGTACLGPELLGRVIDGRGEPLDGKPKPACKARLSLLGLPINPMERGPIDSVLDVGVKAINGLLTLGRGQRVGLVAGSGVGKSVLLGMMTRFTKADVVVIGLVGERGREVQAFIQESLGEEGLAKGIRVKTSSFTRHHVNVSMVRAKASGYYINSILANQEVTAEGYDEALLLDTEGYVSEGAGENVFIVKAGKIYTPDLASCLDGITRDSVLTMARDLGIEITEKRITRDEIYCADEAFFTGTAAEVTPIRELDNRTIGTGSRGPVTEKLQSLFFDVVGGKATKYKHWLTPV
jgi:hypothetical protein